MVGLTLRMAERPDNGCWDLCLLRLHEASCRVGIKDHPVEELMEVLMIPWIWGMAWRSPC